MGGLRVSSWMEGVEDELWSSGKNCLSCFDICLSNSIILYPVGTWHSVFVYEISCHLHPLVNSQCDHCLGFSPRSWDFGGPTWDLGNLSTNLGIFSQVTD